MIEVKELQILASAFLVLCGGALQVDAQQTAPEGVVGESEACHVFSSGQERLDCYDQLTGYTGFEESGQGSQSVWVFEESINPLTDREVSFVLLAVDDTQGSASPDYLVIRCDGEGSAEIIVTTSGYIGGNRGRVSVTYRWNEQEAVAENWQDSTNGQAAFLPRGYRDFRSGLQQGGRLVFQWLDFRGNRSVAIWENVVLDETAQYVLDGCQPTE